MRRATALSLAVASLLVLLKLGAWYATDSVSLLTSLVDSTLDIATSFINFLAVRYALLPPDEEHRFGHGKAEDIAALGQSLFIAGSGLFVVLEAIHRFITPTPLNYGWVGMSVMGFSMFATTLLVLYQRYVIRRTRSNVVASDSLHYLTDILSNFGVIVAIAIGSFSDYVYADPIIALAIAAYIFYGSYQIGLRAFHHLMDREFSGEEREKILAIIHSHPEVMGVHALKTRRSGIYSFIQFHLGLDETLPLRDAHAIADRVEMALEAAFPHSEITVHQDPVPLPRPATANAPPPPQT